MNSQLQGEENRFNVYVRVRPFIEEDYDVCGEDEELDYDVKFDAQYRRKITLFKKNYKDKEYIFDQVFEPSASQKTVYDISASHIITKVFDGYNGTLMAYGQTGSGKTYTIFGTPASIENSQNNEIQQQNGVLFRAMQQIFTLIKQNMDTRQFQVKISFMEIYTEKIYDLLAYGKSAKQELLIRESPDTGVFVNGLTIVSIKSYEEACQLIQDAVKLRTTSDTLQNKTSSRSHALLQILIEQRWIENIKVDQETLQKIPQNQISENGVIKQKHYKKGLLTIVDLAGSERLSKTVSDERKFDESKQKIDRIFKSRSDEKKLEEAKNINKSISTLGKCIDALANENKKIMNKPIIKNFQQAHIPFRDSKLTRVLQDSICGNSYTSLIACISPATINYDETYSTMLFADRAMQITIGVKKNEEIFVKSISKSIDQSNQFFERDQFRNKGSKSRSKSRNDNQGINTFSQKSPYQTEHQRNTSEQSSNFTDLSQNLRYNRQQEKNQSQSLEKYGQDKFRQINQQFNTDNKIQNDMYSMIQKELTQKYTPVIEYLQDQLTKKNLKIKDLENQVIELKKQLEKK